VTLVAGQGQQEYRDSAGWVIKVPAGWHVVPFSDAKDGITSQGVQVSNVPLPAPSLVAGAPIQVNDRVSPAEGVGLVIATDTDPRLARHPVVTPPLPAPNGRYWSPSSSPAGSASMMTLWFRSHGGTFLVCVKIGPRAWVAA
jgi:hypothetical protein